MRTHSAGGQGGEVGWVGVAGDAGWGRVDGLALRMRVEHGRKTSRSWWCSLDVKAGASRRDQQAEDESETSERGRYADERSQVDVDYYERNGHAKMVVEVQVSFERDVDCFYLGGQSPGDPGQTRLTSFQPTSIVRPRKCLADSRVRTRWSAVCRKAPGADPSHVYRDPNGEGPLRRTSPRPSRDRSGGSETSETRLS